MNLSITLLDSDKEKVLFRALGDELKAFMRQHPQLEQMSVAISLLAFSCAACRHMGMTTSQVVNLTDQLLQKQSAPTTERITL
ncbi:MAG TPA: hypothetical protein VHL05_12370 [Terriglobales bacterium]|jgi:hypothetical protein|nr:hypothetical protein [Terriglobales bacterium]